MQGNEFIAITNRLLTIHLPYWLLMPKRMKKQSMPKLKNNYIEILLSHAYYETMELSNKKVDAKAVDKKYFAQQKKSHKHTKLFVFITLQS